MHTPIRIRLNEIIALNPEYTPQELGFTFISRFDQLNRMEYARHHEFYFWICPDCGSELYRYYTYRGSKGGASFVPILSQRGTKEMAECSEAGARVRDEYVNKIEPVIEAAKTNAVCPVCGTALQECHAMRSRSSIDDDLAGRIIDYEFEQLHSNQKAKDRRVAEEAARSYVQHCETNALAQPAAIDVAQIKRSPEALGQYILHLIQLEKDIYSLEKHLPEILSQEATCNRTVSYVENSMAYTYTENARKTKERYDLAKKALESGPSLDKNAVEQEFVAKCVSRKPSEPVKPREPALQKPGLFNKKKVQDENERLMAQHRDAMRDYEAATTRYQQDLAAHEQEQRQLLAAAAEEYENRRQAAAEQLQRDCELARQACEQAAEELRQFQSNPALSDAMVTYQEMVCRDAETAKETLLKLYQARETLYGCNVIFGKYRDLVALSTFYEYLISGRCEKLEGPDGAYNLYESELRANLIISELTKVVASLEDIKKNQFMLYSELRNINSTLHSLKNSMDTAVNTLHSIDASAKRCAENSDIIAHNTAVTAYYSKMNAELTDALGYMVALK